MCVENLEMFSGIDSANILINRIFKNEEFKVRGKFEDQAAEVNGQAAEVKFR
jgi:polyamine oxidase